jgi:acrylyl-CoA reductase (NADPH)
MIIQDVSDQLLELGAKEVIDRLPVEDDHKKPLASSTCLPVLAITL